MPNYDIYPGVDENYNFPPQIKQTIVSYPEIQGTQERMTEAERKIAESYQQIDAANANVVAVKEDMRILDEEKLPQAVEALEAADSAAGVALNDLSERLDTVDTGSSESISQLRADLEAAKAQVTEAKTAAETANQAANAASQAALEAAGIAAAKGRVIVQETEPQGEDRNASNIWIKPIPDDPETDPEEKAVTYIYLSETDEWVPTTSDELAQAAQNALDAREAAQQAQQRAETAISNAAAAQQAAEAAQQTADQATIDAREAHNAAIDAQEYADHIRDDISNGPSLWEDPSFERGNGGVPSLFTDRIVRSDEWSETGDWSIKYIASGSGGNNYGSYGYIPASPGRWYAVSVTVHAGDHEQCINTVWDARTLADNAGENLLAYLLEDGETIVQPQETKRNVWFFQAPAETKYLRYWIGQHSHTNGPENTGQVVYLDDFRLTDVTDSYPQYLAAQEAAQSAHDRADEAYSEAATKATPEQVEAAAQAAEDAAISAASLDAQAKAAAAKAEALAESAVTAQEKADAAQAAAEASAAQIAASQAAQALQDALDALETAKQQIAEDITASANGKNAITRSTTTPSTDGWVEGDMWVQVDGNGDGFAQWYWDGDSWVPSRIKSDMIEALDVHKLQVTGDIKTPEAVIEKLWADGIVSRTMQTSRLAVSPGAVNPDPYFQDTDAWGAGDGNTSFEIIPGDIPENTYFRINTTDVQVGGYYNGQNYRGLTLAPGATYLVELQARFSHANESSLGIYFRNDAHITSAQIKPSGNVDVWENYSATFTFPNEGVSGATFGLFTRNPYFAGQTIDVRRLMVRQQSGTTLIENGAITTPKLTVTEDMAARIVDAMTVRAKELVVSGGATINNAKLIGDTWAENLTAQKIIGQNGIFNGTVDANKINAGSFSGKTFTGGTFTGSRFNATDGNGYGMIIEPQSNYDNAVIFFTDDGSISLAQAAIWRNGYTRGASADLMMRGANGGIVRAQHSFRSGANGIFDLSLTVGGGVNGSKGSVFAPSVDATSYHVRDRITLYGSAAFVNYGTMQQHGSAVYFHNLPSSSGGANVYITDGARRMYQNFSTRRVKSDIEDWRPTAENVLKLRPRQWIHNDPNNDPEDNGAHAVGFIAEEVEEAGLNDLVMYDKDHRPWSLNYDRFPAAQQVVLQKHEEEIQELKAENQSLRDRLEALESLVSSMVG